VAEDTARLRATAEQLVAARATGPAVVERFAAVLEADATGGVAQFELYLEASRDPALRETAIDSLRAYAEVAELALRAPRVEDLGVGQAEIPQPVDVGLLDRRGVAGDLVGQLDDGGVDGVKSGDGITANDGADVVGAEELVEQDRPVRERAIGGAQTAGGAD